MGLTKTVEKLKGYQVWRRSYGYIELLIALFVLIFASDVIPNPDIANIIVPVLSAAMLVSASFAVSRTTATLQANLVLSCFGGICWILAEAVNLYPFNTVVFHLVALAMAMAFILFVTILIIADIFVSPVTTNRICGAVCVYMLIGIAFAVLYTMIVTADVTAFSFSSAHDRIKDLLEMDNGSTMTYFSFCTLTTNGYGDIVPVHRIARLFSWLESMIGQFYLSILVARLVGLYIADEAANRARAGEVDPDEMEQIAT